MAEQNEGHEPKAEQIADQSKKVPDTEITARFKTKDWKFLDDVSSGVDTGIIPDPDSEEYKE